MMELIALMYLFGGAGLAFASWIWVLVIAFRTDFIWGMVLVFFPAVGIIIFGVKYWSKARYPFILHVLSYVAIIIGLFLLPTPPR